VVRLAPVNMYAHSLHLTMIYPSTEVAEAVFNPQSGFNIRSAAGRIDATAPPTIV